MSYFFPGPLPSAVLQGDSIPENTFTVNSGENSLRLLLRSLNLGKGAKVALPLYVCDSVKSAVLKEAMQPVFFDLKAGNSYWTNYDKAQLENQKPSVMVLVHLYGFLHPDTKDILEYCKAKELYVIHDMAQCYGADETDLTYGSTFYSFSAGKSTTAAGGAIIKDRDIDKEFYKRNIKKSGVMAGIKARLFMKSRIYGYRLSPAEKFLYYLLKRHDFTLEITSMSPIQKKAACSVMRNMDKIKEERNVRYALLADAIKGHPVLSIPYSSRQGTHLKFIVYVSSEVERFKTYLANAQVPHFSLLTKELLEKYRDMPADNFQKNAARFVEFSSEASLPVDEIKRVADILNRYT